MLPTIIETSFTCPCCDGRLYSELTQVGVAVFCPSGKCECVRMNDGAEGATLDRAYAALEEKFNTWVNEPQEL